MNHHPRMTSTSFTSSPINKVPYDVLREIFVHCLPQNPLDDFYSRQPNTKIAPMLLCQVCSTWRMVAFSSATLWSHLGYCFTVVDDPDYEPEEDITPDLFLKHEIEFIQWWKENQGSIAPFLYLDVEYKFVGDISRERLALDGNPISFLLDYITSAQCFRIDAFYWNHLHQSIEGGSPVICPNLHTLMVNSECELDDSFYHVQAFMPSHPPLSLRRLSIGNLRLPPPDNTNVPTLWSGLTHISLQHTHITLSFWFSLIRAVPQLQWGCFGISSLYEFNEYARPTECTLSQLVACFLDVPRRQDNATEQLRLLFTNLHLPVLRTLSISSNFHNINDILELRNVLESTPTITSLSLGEVGCRRLSSDGDGVIRNFFSMHSDIELVVESIWRPVTRLEDLKLMFPVYDSKNIADAEETLDAFMRDTLFSNDHWLDLQNPACPIRTVTLYISPFFSRWFRDINRFIMSSTQKHAKKALNVAFQITLTPNLASNIADKAWRDWGSRI